MTTKPRTPRAAKTAVTPVASSTDRFAITLNRSVETHGEVFRPGIDYEVAAEVLGALGDAVETFELLAETGEPA